MKKVGILTFQNAFNYGALLQAYALQEKICDLGYDCKLINYKNDFFVTNYINSTKVFKQEGFKRKVMLLLRKMRHLKTYHRSALKMKKLYQFHNTYFKLSKPIYDDNIKEINDLFDTVVVGSDQVWNTKLYDYKTTYFLDFIDDSTKAITYAASFGKETISGFEYYELKDNLSKYKAIAMRENSGCKLLKEHFNVDSVNVLDPTFLQKKEFWYDLANKSKKKIKEKYILVYLVQEPTNLLKEALRYAEKNNCKIYSLNGLDIKHYKNISDASLEDFLYYIKNAECVFTTSFHGLALSINMNTNFYYELSRKVVNNNARLIDLAAALGLSSREIIEYMDESKIDWDDVNNRLDALREKSINYLKENL